MKTPLINMHDAWEQFDDEAVPRYADGRDCPPWRLDLYELVRAVRSAEPLSTSQSQLAGHIDQCAACRTIYNSALWFLQPESGIPASKTPEESVINELAARREELVDRLRRAQQHVPYRPVSLADYIDDVRTAAGLSEGSVIRALDLPRDAGIRSLNNVDESTIGAVRILGLDPQFVRCSLRYASMITAINQRSGATAPLISALREVVPSTSNCVVACEELERRIDSVADEYIRVIVAACDQELARFLNA